MSVTKNNDLPSLPIDEKISWLFKQNEEHSKKFLEQQLIRRFYRSNHPTEICAFKCMDGRIHIPLVTHTPLGIIQPFRNLAGKFDLGWPYLGEVLNQWVDYSISRGRQCLVLVTYHYSQGNNEHRGCAGFHYNKEASFKFTTDFKEQFERMFGKNNQIVFPVIMGFETDGDSLILHGEDPQNILDVATLPMAVSDDDLISKLNELYPSIPKRVIDDILPLVKGNIEHVAEIKAANRPILDSEHREWILGVGRGFDWLHEPNTALIIGPYSPNLSEPIKIAAKIIKSNMDAGRISNDGFVMLASSPYREMGADRQRAIEKARFIKGFAQEVISSEFPELQDKMKPMAVILDLNTRKLQEIK